jgi:hypothetical protein
MNNQEFIPVNDLNFKIFVDGPSCNFRVLGLSSSQIKISIEAKGNLCKLFELFIQKNGHWNSYQLKILDNVESSSIFQFQLEGAHKKDFLKDLFDRSPYNSLGGKL